MNTFEKENQKEFRIAVQAIQRYITFYVKNGEQKESQQLAKQLANMIETAVISWKDN